MKVTNERPPIWEEANKLLDIEGSGRSPIFTYGDTIFNPYQVPLTDDLIAHEMVHGHQQAFNDVGANLWWQAWLKDPAFRLDQEARAYGAQYRCICGNVHDRNKQTRNLWHLADQLSAPIYGGIVTKPDAIALIKKYSRDNVDNSDVGMHMKVQ